MGGTNGAIETWFSTKGWSAFDFQRRTWRSYLDGDSGLVHAPTGMGKTLAVWLGPVSEYLDERGGAGDAVASDVAEPLRVLWITPLRALANDTVESLREPIADLGLPWTVEKRTGDTSSTMKARQRKTPATCLVTTPESLSLFLSYPETRTTFRNLQCVVVDEWHELLSSKRGTQTELALARLRAWNPALRTWGLSATLGNLEEACDALIGANSASRHIIGGVEPKQIGVESLLPDDIERFPWSGHLGIRLLDEVIERISQAQTSLLFTNTRSQAEIWFGRLVTAKPEWLGQIAIHHGSLDRDVRTRVEAGLAEGSLRAVVCTSSLDLGVDFSPVDQVLQIGSPKGIARLTQRAGRSGHRPGASSRVVCVPAHAFELVEFSAARDGIDDRDIEARVPLNKPLDVLVQHLVTVGLGGGFDEEAQYEEVRTAHAYRDLSRTEFGWALDFVTRGGPALRAYPQYQRVERDDATGRYAVTDRAIGRSHRLGIGTITSDISIVVRFGNGRSLGTIEESFITRLTPGDRFVFAGRILELVRVRDMAATVRVSKSTRGVVPRWGGGRSPLSTRLSARVRSKIESARRGDFTGAEMRAVRPLLELQARCSILPRADELLIEAVTTEDGHHRFLFPFEGRLVHEGLGALIAHRLAARSPVSLSVTVNDYGIELLSPTPFATDEETWRDVLRPGELLDDLLGCLNSNELAKRRFRDIARVAGLISPGFPGSGKSARQLQASSSLIFDVFLDFDPANLLLDQARREVLEEQLEVRRLRCALERLTDMRLSLVSPEHLTPLAFPLFAETLRTQHVSSEKWSDRIARMAMSLDRASDG